MIKNIVMWTFYIITFAIIAGVLLIVFAIFSPHKTTQQKENEINYLIKKVDFGAKYPYTKDNLILRCEPDRASNSQIAIWLETENGDKYGLNGISYNKFTRNSDKTYKGFTDKILIKGKVDLYSPVEAEKYCLKTGF